MTKIDQQYIQELFIKYARVNTRSNPAVTDTPTTPGQVELAKAIVDDLRQLGLSQVAFDEPSGYVIASIASNVDADVTPIGYIAHLDTADFNAENINPQVHKNYDGKPIVLNAEENITLSSEQFPKLKRHIGETLITTDGTTLLGADDKAGIAEIIGMLKYYQDNPEVKHGPVFVGFGPDEEIGKGAKQFPVERFPVEFAYTLDNGDLGEIRPETFNASQAAIDVEGTAVHPGDAYGLLTNAITIANEIISQLPKDEVPEKSRGHEGFFLVTNLEATIDKAHFEIIIRDFDNDKFVEKENLLKKIVNDVNSELDRTRVQLVITEQYQNIWERIKANPYIINVVLDTMKRANIDSHIIPFRGGTDGNFITQKGIPTPNLFNGGDNFHGQYEYVTTESMAEIANFLVQLNDEHVKQTGHRNNQLVK
ncbi:peptidase T [Lentilactobacillus sp. SPB1-3]|uniref:Peptidase T n=1 Tax=Lentilactobacillus terminaliae TaxID=3003483 RepID=A0ACD5DDR8_9LACO|nr:peptidase T [Lentilactobacillus sp. SPB1-3]MCZ0977650.1 peptidase T [Lentilactobacillus sp. SPB1-3]